MRRVTNDIDRTLWRPAAGALASCWSLCGAALEALQSSGGVTLAIVTLVTPAVVRVAHAIARIAQSIVSSDAGPLLGG